MATASATPPQSTLVSIPPASMFQDTPFYLVGTDVVFGLRVPPLGPSPQDQILTVPGQYANRLDKVSNDMYGDPSFFWALGDANNLIDLMAGVPIGTQLRIPPKSTINTLS